MRALLIILLYALGGIVTTIMNFRADYLEHGKVCYDSVADYVFTEVSIVEALIIFLIWPICIFSSLMLLVIIGGISIGVHDKKEETKDEELYLALDDAAEMFFNLQDEGRFDADSYDYIRTRYEEKARRIR